MNKNTEKQTTEKQAEDYLFDLVLNEGYKWGLYDIWDLLDQGPIWVLSASPDELDMWVIAQNNY